MGNQSTQRNLAVGELIPKSYRTNRIKDRQGHWKQSVALITMGKNVCAITEKPLGEQSVAKLVKDSEEERCENTNVCRMQLKTRKCRRRQERRLNVREEVEEIGSH